MMAGTFGTTVILSQGPDRRKIKVRLGAEGRDWEGKGSKVDGELAAEEPAAGVEETEGIEGVQVLLHVAGVEVVK